MRASAAPQVLSRGGSADSGLSLALADFRTKFFEYELLENDADKSAALPSLLSLFLNVFDNVPPPDVLRQFGRESLQSFATHVSHFLVKSIRRLAADRSTEAASSALVAFFRQSTGGDALRVLRGLALVGDPAVEPMASMSLPSTLVKSLYLFLDLPADATAEVGRDPSGGGDGTAAGSAAVAEAGQLEETFTQLLCALFRERRATQETLSAVDAAGVSDISRLFDLIITPCAPHNYQWRRAAKRVILTMFTHTLDAALVGYIQRRSLIRQSLDGALLTTNLDLETKTDVLECVCECLYKASALRASRLLDDFAHEEGYRRLAEVVLDADALQAAEEVKQAERAAISASAVAAEPHPPADRSGGGSVAGGATGSATGSATGGATGSTTGSAVTSPQPLPTAQATFIQRLIAALARLCFAGQLDLKFEMSKDHLQDPAFHFPRPSGFGKSVRNLVAFHALQSLFLKASAAATCDAAMDAIVDVYTCDPANYFILRGERALSRMVQRIDETGERTRRRVLKLLEFVVCSLNYVPSEELRVLALKIKGSNTRASAASLHTLIKFINFNSRFVGPEAAPASTSRFLLPFYFVAHASPQQC
jgi:hypothetical protein